jgi:hypothetical protein
MGQCTAKDLWLNLENIYQYKEDNPIKENEGKDSPNFSNDNTPTEFECSLTKEEEYIEEVCIEFENDEEEYLLKIKDNGFSKLDYVFHEIGNSSNSF